MALAACGDDVAGTEPPTTGSPPAGTIGAGAPAEDDPCAFVDLAAVEALIGEPVDIRSDVDVVKPGIESGVSCTIRSAGAEDTFDTFLGGVTLYRYADDATARQVFDNDVTKQPTTFNARSRHATKTL